MKQILVALACVLAIASQVEANGEPAYRAEAQRLETFYALPPGLLEHICTVESHWKPGAVGELGEIGLCQLQPRFVAPLVKPGTLPAPSGEAVARFQTYAGIAVDGIIGPQTREALTTRSNGKVVLALFDPYENLHWAARYLVSLRTLLKTNSPDILAAAYNGGPGSPAVRYMLKIRRVEGEREN